MAGTMIVSLDFELFWGLLEEMNLDDYRQNILGGRAAIPRLLKLFEQYDIHATWATVGFLFAQNYEQLQQYFPEQIGYLFFVALAKNLTSMENIDLLISVQRSTYTLPVAYDYMCRELENMLYYFFGLKDAPEDVGETESDEKNLLQGLIMSAANVIYLNNYIEYLRKQAKE